MNNSLFVIERARAEDAFHIIFQQALTSNHSVTIIEVTERLLVKGG